MQYTHMNTCLFDPIVESFGIPWVKQCSINVMLDVGFVKTWQQL